jgi:hypothetical protein
MKLGGEYHCFGCFERVKNRLSRRHDEQEGVNQEICEIYTTGKDVG